MEMCFIGKIDYTAGIYCLVASFTGYFTSLAMGIQYESNVIASVPDMTPRTVAIVVIGGIIFGLTARLFAWSVRTVKSLYGRFITNYLARALVGALVVLAAYAILDAWDYAGLSTWLSDAGFAGNTTLADAVIKLVVTALTLGTGFKAARLRPCLVSVRRSADGSAASLDSTRALWRPSACSASSAPASTCPSPPA